VSRHIVWRLIFVILVIAGAVAIIVTNPVKLGLDLEGGTQIVLEAQDTPEQTVDDDTVDRTLEVLRRRVDQLGVSEPNVQESGDRRIIIELPGVSDPDQALEVIGQTAQLTFHPVLGVQQDSQGDDQDQNGEERTDDERVLQDEDGNPVRIGPPALTGDAVGDAEAVIDSQAGSAWTVSIAFRGDGGEQWEG
jgi:SecD/SecF fusion protein